MKVILKKDVAKIGQRGSVVEVKSGYAQNFLFPQNLAEVATPQKIAHAQKNLEATTAQREADQKALEGVAKTYTKTPLTIAAKANEQGHLFEGITAPKIAEALTKASGTTVLESAISIDTPLKETGDHEVGIVAGDTTHTLTVTIAAEE